MPTITTSPTGIVYGVSDDGRITYASCQDGPTIDGRRAWRRLYINPDNPWPGEADKSMPVDPVDWQAACALMAAVDAVDEGNKEASRLRAAEEDVKWITRRAEIIEIASRGRGSAYDPNIRD